MSAIPNAVPKASGPPPIPRNMKGRNLEVRYSHIHHGGLIGMDTALLYGGGWSTAGMKWHHNWIHDGSEKCLRADDQSRNISAHHNGSFLSRSFFLETSLQCASCY